MSLRPSPRKMTGVGPTQNFLPMDAPDSNCRSSRSAIKTELPDKLVFDDVDVFRRLGISQVPEVLVNACMNSFHSANAVSIKELQRITAAAEGKDLDELEAGITVVDDNGEKKKMRRKETKMYPHLVRYVMISADITGVNSLITIGVHISIHRDVQRH